MLVCACGRQQKVPTLSALRQLAPVEPPSAALSGARNRRRAPLIVWLAPVLGISVAAILGAWTSRFWVLTPEIPAINVRDSDPDLAEAVAVARAAVEQSPRSADAWGHLAMVLHGNALERSADTCYAAAADLDPSNPDWLYLRGYMQQDGAGGPETAIPLYQRAASLSPPNAVARLRLGDMLVAQGRLDEASQEFQKVLAADPQDAEARLGEASIAIARRQDSEARDVLESIVEHPLVRRRASELLAGVCQRLGDAAAAQQQRDRLNTTGEEESRPDDAMHRVGELQVGITTRLRKASMLSQQRRFDEAIAMLKETVVRYPQADEAWSNLGAGLNHMGDLDGAEQALRKCIDLAPKSAEYRLHLGMLLLPQSRFEEAAATFRVGIELRPTLGPAYFGLGESLLGLNDKPGALKAFRQGLAYMPENELLKERLKALGEDSLQE